MPKQELSQESKGQSKGQYLPNISPGLMPAGVRKAFLAGKYFSFVQILLSVCCVPDHGPNAESLPLPRVHISEEGKYVTVARYRMLSLSHH